MFKSLGRLAARTLVSQRENTEILLRSLYKSNAQADLNEMLSMYNVSPAQVARMFDRLDEQFGKDLRATDDRTVERAIVGSLTSIMRSIDAFADEADQKSLYCHHP